VRRSDTTKFKYYDSIHTVVSSAVIRVTRLFAAITVCLLVGWAGLIFTTPVVRTWYTALVGPALFLPTWLFNPAWMLLFILMGITLYLVWNKGWSQKNVQEATAIFAVQLVLIVIWSYLLFTLQVPFFALIGSVLLWFAILMTIGAFYRVSVPAAALLMPCLFWATFAIYFTYNIYLLSP